MFNVPHISSKSAAVPLNSGLLIHLDYATGVIERIGIIGNQCDWDIPKKLKDISQSSPWIFLTMQQDSQCTSWQEKKIIQLDTSSTEITAITIMNRMNSRGILLVASQEPIPSHFMELLVSLTQNWYQQWTLTYQRNLETTRRQLWQFQLRSLIERIYTERGVLAHQIRGSVHSELLMIWFHLSQSNLPSHILTIHDIDQLWNNYLGPISQRLSPLSIQLGLIPAINELLRQHPLIHLRVGPTLTHGDSPLANIVPLWIRLMVIDLLYTLLKHFPAISSGWIYVEVHRKSNIHLVAQWHGTDGTKMLPGISVFVEALGGHSRQSTRHLNQTRFSICLPWDSPVN